MGLLADVGGLLGVRNTLNQLAVPQEVIDKIIKILQQESDTLEGGKFNPVPATWFGSRASGANLGQHTEKAHARLSNAVLEAVAGLQSTEMAIVQFDKELEDADVNSHAATQALLVRTQQAVDQLDDNFTTPPAGRDK
jgi:hypothetical protein